MKWILVIILLIVAGLAAFVAFEYFTVGIHALPSYIPGHEATVRGHKHGPRGHYRKRGAAAAVISFILLVIAGWLTARNMRADKMGGPATPAAA